MFDGKKMSMTEKYNIMSTPGLVLNEKIVSAGRIPSEAEITTYLTSALAVV
jgi:hypothetical protein